MILSKLWPDTFQLSTAFIPCLKIIIDWLQLCEIFLVCLRQCCFYFFCFALVFTSFLAPNASCVSTFKSYPESALLWHYFLSTHLVPQLFTIIQICLHFYFSQHCRIIQVPKTFKLFCLLSTPKLIFLAYWYPMLCLVYFALHFSPHLAV